jgi:hypothetical protein
MRCKGTNGYWLTRLGGGVDTEWTQSGSRRFWGAEPAGVVALELPDLVTRPDDERSTLTSDEN